MTTFMMRLAMRDWPEKSRSDCIASLVQEEIKLSATPPAELAVSDSSESEAVESSTDDSSSPAGDEFGADSENADSDPSHDEAVAAKVASAIASTCGFDNRQINRNVVREDLRRHATRKTLHLGHHANSGIFACGRARSSVYVSVSKDSTDHWPLCHDV